MLAVLISQVKTSCEMTEFHIPIFVNFLSIKDICTKKVRWLLFLKFNIRVVWCFMCLTKMNQWFLYLRANCTIPSVMSFFPYFLKTQYRTNNTPCCPYSLFGCQISQLHSITYLSNYKLSMKMIFQLHSNHIM